jgi:hypothetical protein
VLHYPLTHLTRGSRTFCVSAAGPRIWITLNTEIKVRFWEVRSNVTCTAFSVCIFPQNETANKDDKCSSSISALFNQTYASLFGPTWTEKCPTQPPEFWLTKEVYLIMQAFNQEREDYICLSHNASREWTSVKCICHWWESNKRHTLRSCRETR